MSTRSIRRSVAALFVAGGTLAGAAAHAQSESLKLKMSGSIEVGGMHHRLSAGYGSWNGQFVRGTLQTSENTVWNGELLNTAQYGDSGVLAAVGATHTLNEKWYVSGAVSTSGGGFFLPRLRLDVTLNRKWLDALNLVTTVGFTAVNAKDGHRDRSVLLAASYYFEQPWIVEGGVRLNNSNPGSVNSAAWYVAATWGHDKKRLLSLRYGRGEEAYQLTGSVATLASFYSSGLTFTWREWFSREWGAQFRADTYRSPNYDRHGIELSVFRDF